jgi:hypothetical protein
MNRYSRAPIKNHAASLTLTVMICLTLVTALSVAWLRNLVLERRAVDARQQRVQAEYLVQSGLARGAAKVRADARYAGETWRIEPGELDGWRAAAVTIEVTRPDTPSHSRVIKVVARLPDHFGAATERGGKVEITIPKAGEAP